MSFIRKYAAVLVVETKNAFAYRMEGVVFFMADLMAPLLMMIAWKAIYETRQEVGGYSVNQILFYYLLIFIFRTVLSVYPHDLSSQIRTGKLNSFLMRPFNILLNQLASEIGWKVIRLVFLTIATTVLVRTFFNGGQLPSLQIFSLSFLIALVNALLLNYFIKVVIELTAFWTSEVSGLRASFYILESLFSGSMLPLNLLPKGIEILAQFLPYKFFYYFPIEMVLGKLNTGEIIKGLLLGFGWLIIAIGLSRFLMKEGLKRYDAYSG